MSKTGALSRRRAIQIVASAAGLALVTGLRGAPAAPRSTVHTWRGIALGAQASITLCHHDAAQARRLLRLCVSEIRRLEAAFSLYRRGSAITQLNRDGYLDHPPPDLVRLLATARMFGDATQGAFDPTVQPLWTLYATHFTPSAARPEGPDGSAIDKAMALVDYRNVSLTTTRVAFERRGMGITLNGIAQGYITDRVAELLRNEGLDDVLVDLGEIRGLGRHADGRPWTVGLKDPLEPGRIVDTLTLENRALASSAGAATRFDVRGRHHHLFDPHSGASANRYLGITVIAPTATTADALSTSFASMDMDEVKKVLRFFPSVTARITTSAGELVTL